MKNRELFAQISHKFNNLPAIIIILIVIISMMSPLGSNIPAESPAKDLLNHISGIIEAKNALVEGQFPIRVAPNALDGIHYPIFQYYGNFPYTLGGLFYILFNDPYLSFKLVIMLSLFLGAYYLYKFGIWTTNNKYAAIIASVAYLTAPYILIDIHGRFAFPELVALGLIPGIFYYTFKSLHSKGINECLGLSFLLALLFLTHNVFCLYTVTFLGIILFIYLICNRSCLFPVLRVGLSIIVAFLLSCWYIIPILISSKDLVITSLQQVYNPYNRIYLTSLWGLLAPSKILPLPLNYFDNPNLGLQIGYVMLAFLGCGIYVIYNLLKNGEQKIDSKTIKILSILIICSFLSFVLTWSPVDFWAFLPMQFYYVQVPFRILGYLVIFVSMLTPIALTKTFDNFNFQQALIFFLICILFTSTYLPNHVGDSKDAIANEISHPDMGRGGATYVYQMSPEKLSNSANPYGEKKELIDGYCGDKWLLSTAKLRLDASKYGESIIIRIKGRVPAEIQSTTLHFFVNGEPAGQMNLMQGSFDSHLAIDNLSKFQNTSSDSDYLITINSDKYFIPHDVDPTSVDQRQLAILVDSFAVSDSIKSLENFISIGDPKTQKISSNQLVVNNDVASMVELPILYYPEMIDVKVNGQSVQYYNLGANVGITLPPGKNNITYQFVGLPWANYLSLMSWLLFCSICVYQLRKILILGMRDDN